MTSLESRFTGSILGLALGDAFGAPREGGILERALWRLIGRSGGRRRFTDDTQMTIDVIESLVERKGVDQNDLARRFAGSYRWSRGYGPGAAKALKRIRKGRPWQEASRSVRPEGSLGNGGAMRAPAVGLFFHAAGDAEIALAASAAAEVTHAHAEGREGAALIALATALSCQNLENKDLLGRVKPHLASPEHLNRLAKVEELIQKDSAPDPGRAVRELGNGIRAAQSCCTALYAALAFREKRFEELLSFCMRLGGDVDTIAAMAGAIWGAANGFERLPGRLLDEIEDSNRLRGLALSLHETRLRHEG